MEINKNIEKVDIPISMNEEVVSTTKLIAGDIKALKEENKRLKKSLTDTRCRVILLEENYITLLEDISQSAKIDLAIYFIFAICIAILGFYVYGLTH